MARLVPEGEGGGDAAERVVVEALRTQLPAQATVLANLHIVTDRGDREADAVVVWPGHGVALVEVKGGPVEFVDGKWFSHKGRRLRPMEQLKACKYGIRSVLRQHPRWSAGDPRMSHHIALPHTALPEGFTTAECPRAFISDESEMDTLAERIAAQLHASRNGHAPLTPQQADDLVRALTGPMRPQSDFATVNAAAIAERDDHVAILTEQQYKVLKMIREQRRAQIIGGAGTGKTFLAVEQARALAAEGKRVALTCYSKGLATWLQRRFEAERHRPDYIGTFHALGVQWGTKKGRVYTSHEFEHELPAAMVDHARKLTYDQRYDAMVIDEAQDFGPNWWEPIVTALKDPEHGRVIRFADRDQIIFPRGSLPDDEFTTTRLDENLRNTAPITRVFERYGTAPLVSRGGDGTEVRWVPSTPERAVDAADAEVQRLVDQGWAPEHVMLLTTWARHPEHAMRVQHRYTDGYWDSFWEDDDVFYGTVQGSKGLERPAVVLAVNGFADLRSRLQMLYVGMSRARDLLVVCGQSESLRPS